MEVGIIRNFRKYGAFDERNAVDKAAVELKNYNTGEIKFCRDLRELHTFLGITKYTASNYVQSRRFFLNKKGEVMLALRREKFPQFDDKTMKEVRDFLATGFRINTIDEIHRLGHVIDQERNVFHVVNIETGEKRIFPTECATLIYIGHRSNSIDRDKGFFDTREMVYNGFNVQYRPLNKTIAEVRHQRKPIASVWDLAAWA